jgi:signal peptidase I
MNLTPPSMPETPPTQYTRSYAWADINPEGKSSLSACAAMLFPSLGHFIAGAKVRGAMWLVLSLVAVAGTITGYFVRQYEPIFFVAAPLLVLIYLLQWFDAGRCGRESQGHMFLDPTMRKMVAAIFATAAILLQGTLFWQLQKNIVQLCYTPTPSMKPTVAPGDYFLVFKGRPFIRWDIVGVSVPPGGRYSGLDGLCKRVIGLPGETIELTGDGVTINGKVVPTPSGAGPFLPVDISHNPLGDSEPMSAATGCWGKPITLGPDEYYLLGDNTLDSDDSRFWEAFPGHQPGGMPADKIVSRVAGIVWPPARWQIFK